MKSSGRTRRLYLLVILLVTIVVGLFAIFAFIKPRVGIAEEKEAIEIKVQPTGKLNVIPRDMVFHFSRAFPGVAGVTIDADSLPRFISFEPEVRAQGYWISEKTFELTFIEDPLPDQKYNVKLTRIPLLTGEEEIKPRKYSFETPPFQVQHVSLNMILNKRATIAIDFNYQPVMREIDDYIKVFDSEYKKVDIVRAYQEKEEPYTVYITVPFEKAPETHTVIVKKGLASILDVSLKKDVKTEIAIGFTTKPLVVKDRRVEESEDGYMVVFHMSATKERKFDIRDRNLAKFVRIDPEIEFRAAAAGRFIYVFADFIPAKTYKITLKAGVMTDKDNLLLDDYATEIVIPQRKEAFQFVYRGRYFGRTGEWKLPLQVAQVDSVKIDMTYVPSENILFWHLKDRGRKQNMHALGEKVVEKHTIQIEDKSKTQILWVDLREFLPSFSRGAYLVEARGFSKKRGHLNDRIAVVISDISLVVKWFDRNVDIWAFNSATLEPENGVSIEVRSRKNFLTGTGTTDVSGRCHITALKEGRDPFIVFAKKGDEWTYMHTPSLQLAKAVYDVSGEIPTISYLAYVYPERDLYRPGEEVHFGVVLREKHSFSGVSLPVRISIRDPQGKDYLSLTGETNIHGLAEFTFMTAPSSPTGKYMINVLVGDHTLYTGHVFVETFVPERMRVTVSLPDTIDIYRSFPVSIEAEYLFGAPAVGEQYTISVRAEEKKFRCSGYYDYSFGMYTFRDAKVPSWRSDRREGTLDARGRSAEDMRIDTNLVFQGPVLLQSYVTVTEGGSGRATSKNYERLVYTQPYYIGLKSSVRRVVAGHPVTVKGVLLKPDCSLYTGSAKLICRVFRLVHSYSYRYYEDYYWDSRLQKVPVMEARTMTADDGTFSFSFTPKGRRHDYLIEVSDEKHGTTSQTKIAGWGWWRYREEDEVESPEVVSLRTSKREYDFNEQVTVEALLPFEGKILWTVELDTIYHAEWAEARGEVAKWSFRAPKGVSNVYVSALLVRTGGNYLVQRGYGIERVRIRPEKLKLTFTVDVPERIRPGNELAINIHGSDRFVGTIAVVDEGILQITDFKSPDPFEKILRDMRLSMNTAESFGWIIKKFLEKTGGGVAAREEEFPEARFARIVSFWSGIRESRSDGRLTYKIKIPEYNGKLRIMVLGVNAQRFGAAEASVIVKSDVIVSPTIPRFMYTEDRFSFPITLINTTNQQKKADISVKLTGGSLENESKTSVSLQPQEKRLLWYNCSAGEEPGALDLTIDGVAEREKYHEDFVLPLYPNVPFIREAEYVTIDPGEKADLTKYFEEWYPRAHTAQLILSTIPALTRLNHTRYVIRYPYGCIEQTSTTTLVLLRLASLLPVIAPKVTQEAYSEMVNHGIQRIIAMQTISGGFSFWPGGGAPSPWGSSYATFVLLEAKGAGFVVPEGVLKAALNYLDALPEKNGLSYFVLARGGFLQKKPELIERLIALGLKEEYDASSALWIAGTVREAGKSEVAKRLLDIALKCDAPTKRMYSHDFLSPLKLKGLKLYMILNVNPGIPEESEIVLDIAKELARRRRSYYYTTQELTWTLLSLGLYVDRIDYANINAQLKLEGRSTKPQSEKGVLAWNLKNVAQHKSVTLETSSQDVLYLSIENSGFSRKERSFQFYSKGITLWRRIYNYYGDPVSSAMQGDLYVVRIAVLGNYNYPNVAIEVPVPAGLEIENPRLGRDDLPTWATAKRRKLWHPEYIDIRDDRVMIFGTAHADTQYYFFLTRAVTPGTFFLPPASGVVMYDPEMNAHTDDAKFKVLKR